MDEIFKSSLDNLESEVNPQIWQNLSKELIQPKNQPLIGINTYILSGILIAIVGVTSWYLLSNQSAVSDSQTDDAISLVETSNSEKINQNFENDTKSKNNETQSSINDLPTPTKKTSSTVVKRSNKEKKQATTSSSNISDNKTLSTAYRSTNGINSILNSQESEIKSERKSFVSSINTSTENIVNKPLASEIETENKIERSLFSELIKNKSEENEYEPVSKRVLDEDIKAFQKIKQLENEDVYLEGTAPKPLKRKAQECPSFYRNIWVPYMWLEYGNILPNRKLSPKSEFDQAYLDLREDSETMQYSFDIAGGFGIKAPSGVFGELGLQYSQLQERFSYTDPESIKKTQVITNDTIIMGGQVSTFSDTTYIDIPGALNIVTNNKYRFVNFPIMLGYEKGINESFSLAAKAGVAINFSAKQKGRFVNEENVPVWFSSNNLERVEAYKNQIGINYMLGIQATYHIGSLVSLYVAPQVKFIPKTITLDSYALNQTYINPSLSVGMKFSI